MTLRFQRMIQNLDVTNSIILRKTPTTTKNQKKARKCVITQMYVERTNQDEETVGTANQRAEGWKAHPTHTHKHSIFPAFQTHASFTSTNTQTKVRKQNTKKIHNHRENNHRESARNFASYNPSDNFRKTLKMSVTDEDIIQLNPSEDVDFEDELQEVEQVVEPTQRKGPGTGPKRLGKV